MRWFEVKEQSAGKKRLKATWYFYKIAGKGGLNIVAFFVALFTFLFSKQIRYYSKKYLKIIKKDSLLNEFKHFLNYAFSQTDKIEAFSGNYDCNKITFATFEEEKLLIDNLKNKRGMFFICSHLGNSEILRVLTDKYKNDDVNIFLSEKHCKIFRDFIKEIELKTPIKTYEVENIDLNTAIEVHQSLERGGIVFMAGDRTSKDDKNIFKTKLFDKTVEFPIGTFRFAQMTKAPIYYIVAVKTGAKYKVYMKKAPVNSDKKEETEMLKKGFAEFLEEKTLLYPLQFYHFYDLFEE